MLRDALLENIHRANLNPLEEAAAYQQLLEEFGATHEELARAHRPEPAADLQHDPAAEPPRLRSSGGSPPACSPPAMPGRSWRSTTPEQQEPSRTRIVAEGLSVRATEEASRSPLAEGAPPKKRRPAAPSRTRPG